MAFRFGNDIVKIEIEDLIFRVFITQELRMKIIENNEKVGELRNNIAEKCDKEKESDIITEFDKLIDELLGKGASAKIFAEREPDAFERIITYLYIFECIMAHINGIKHE